MEYQNDSNTLMTKKKKATRKCRPRNATSSSGKTLRKRIQTKTERLDPRTKQYSIGNKSTQAIHKLQGEVEKENKVS